MVTALPGHSRGAVRGLRPAAVLRSVTQLARLHMWLTEFIVSMQAGDAPSVGIVAEKIRRKYGFLPADVVEADRLRREVHRAMVELARNGPADVKYTGPFAVPDVEAAVLSRVEEIPGGVVEVGGDEVSVYYRGEGETLYGEPVDMFFLDVRWFNAAGTPVVDVTAESSIPFPEADVYMEDAEPVDDEEALRLFKRYGPEAVAMLEPVEYAFYISRNEVYGTFDPSIALPDGRILFALPMDDRYEYTLASLFRMGADIRSRVVEEANRRLGEDFFRVDRMYHVYPAELDVGAPGDAVVHVVGSKMVPIHQVWDEFRAARLVARVLDALIDIL